MARGQKLIAVSYVNIGGKEILFDDLTEEQKEEFRQKVSERIGKTLSWYLSEHPEELASLQKYRVDNKTEGDRNDNRNT
ncbi:hypothetical protein [Ruminococcus sp.]|uniref:hypothetical protein n=1 Tax=Ruminococcus sp. TaxID=41978 RepID=UPI001B3CDECE|nr:hypothetical protein [Ruminococcus sp.]MBP5431553.1 hypothetical protein [Ruminococcus sp.]